MKRSIFSLIGLFLIIYVLFVDSVLAQEKSFEQGLNEIAKQVTESIPAGKTTTIAVMDFNDLQGNITMLGRYVGEELITTLFQTKRFKVIERSLLDKAINELKFNMTDLVDTSKAKQLGKVVGAEAIVTGTLTDLGKSIKVNARVITVESGEIIGASRVNIAKDESLVQMFNKVLPQSSPSLPQKNTITESDSGSLANDGGTHVLPGIEVTDLTPDLRDRYVRDYQEKGGVLVMRIAPGTKITSQNGKWVIMEGDMIERVDGMGVLNVRHFQDIITQLQPKARSITLMVRRHDRITGHVLFVLPFTVNLH